jgi:thymidylate synthase
MKEYLTALEYILENGKDRDDRTGVGTRGVVLRG